jgi:hypothetical protein
VNEGTGGGGRGATTTVWVAELDPAALPNVNVTTYEPGSVYTFVGLASGEGGLPSPKFHEYVVAGPPVDALVKVTVASAKGFAGETVNAAIGAGGLTATDRVIVLVPVWFVTVKRTG